MLKLNNGKTPSVTLTVSGRLTTSAAKLYNQNENGKYQAIVVIEDDKYIKMLEEARDMVAKATFGDKPVKYNDFVVREGDDPEYEVSFEKHYINAKANPHRTTGRGPAILKRIDGAIVPVDAEEDLIYAGCYVAVNINVYPIQENKALDIKKGVTIGLNKVLFVRDGERLSGGESDEESFDGFDSEFSDVEEF